MGIKVNGRESSTAVAAPLADTKPLYAHQSLLPRLPVPDLQSTISKYLESVKPLLSPSQFDHTTKQCEAFLRPGSIGHVLQERLLQRAKEKKNSSWLIDWWNEIAYFGYREPVVINVSYFFVFADDPRRQTQTSRAASIIKGAFKFREQVVRETLEPERTKAGPLCSDQYRYLFNTCRIPARGKDYSVTSSEEHTHVVVVRKNQFWTFDVCPNGMELSTADIEWNLKKVVELSGTEPADPVGVLTADNRDRWTEYRTLLMTDARNRDSLQRIESAMFVVCLDDVDAVTREECNRLMWHGDARNRWFDKSIQFVVTENGRAGILNEHSKADGTAATRMSDWMLHQLATNGIDHGPPDPASNLHPPTPLGFSLNMPLLDGIHRASTHVDNLIAAHDVRVLAWSGYGKNFIKACGLSPDAFMQMIIQLAYYRMFGTLRATYESAQTRMYLHGRTETCRTVTEEVREFVEGFQDLEVPEGEKAERLKRAVKKHSENMAECVKGFGVDRHLLGLRLSLKPEEPKPGIFTDKAFSSSSHWYLSTSQLSSEYFSGYGWGEVVPDGFGFPYMIQNESLHVSVSCLRTEMGPQGASRMRYHLEESMRDVGKVLAKTLYKPKPRM